MTKLNHLFQPIKIGSLELDNRIVMTCANASGGGGEHVVKFYEERAKGGAGLLIVGGLSTFDFGPQGPLYEKREGIDEEEWQATREFALYSDELIPGLRRLTKAVHDNGSKAAAQLLLRYEWKKDWRANPEAHNEVVGASDVDSGPRMGQARALTVDEIHQIVEEFGDSARRAREAGFDAVEIHAGIGYLLNRFLSPCSNKRTDEYGGSGEKRMRILLEIVECCQRKAGGDYPILVRFSADDFMEGGDTLEDTRPIAMALERAGVAALDVEVGWHESPRPMVQQWVAPGVFVTFAEEIKRAVSIPVITAYRIYDPVMADRIVAEGRADLVGMARALIADPELPNKAREGRLNEINYCIACCRCLDTAIGGERPACTINARVGWEAVLNIEPAPQTKRVLVVGGGPAGMEAARVAALRGHQVTLCDRGPRLGGSLLMASILNPELPKFLKYLSREVRRLPIEIRLNTEADAAFIEGMKPDAVIVAVGGTPPPFDIPGVEGDNVLRGHDMVEAMVRPPQRGGLAQRLMWCAGSLVLRHIGRPELIRWGMRFGFPFKKRVVIIGGGFAGCELADVLAERGKQVTVLESSRRLGYDIGITTRWVVMLRLRLLGVNLVRNATAVEITEKGVKTMVEDTEAFFEADTVALTMPLSPDDSLARELEGKGLKVHSAGDCAATGRILEAMAAGFRAGSEV